ncbi:MAG: M20 family metallopeptidase [Alphaproteobacteria bacterium]|nr:M20 family metallopeptidase [Alphaproteobacteria bacterium]
MIDKTIEILDKLISIDTTITIDTMAAVDYIQELLDKSGARTHRVMSPNGKRASLLATIGDPVRAGVIFSGHMDTVAAAADEWNYPPHKLTLVDSRLYGRGTTDMKGAIAAILANIDALAASGNTYHIVLTHDEEGGFSAIRQLVASNFDNFFGAKPRGCIVMEPTELTPIVAHKGGFRAQINVTGKSAHSAYPELGVDAGEYIVRAYIALREIFKKHSESWAPDDCFSPNHTTVNIGTLCAGDAVNKIPGSAELSYMMRYLPGNDIIGFNNDIAKLCKDLDIDIKSKDPSCSVEFIPGVNVESFAADANSDFVKMFGKGAKVSFATEAGFFAKLGIPTIVFGPGNIAQAHTVDEFIEISELEKFNEWIKGI